MVKRIWHSVLLLVLVLVTTGTKANTIAMEHAPHVEVSLLKSCSNKATLPDVLQVANYLPVPFRSSNFIVSAGRYAELTTGPVPNYSSSNIFSFLNSTTPSIPIHIANRVLLI